jgi:integrase
MRKKSEPKTRAGTVPIKFIPSRDRWQLTIHSHGKRTRTFYPSEASASEAWADHCRKKKRFGTDGEVLSPNETREFSEARRLIPGVDLRDVARFYLMHHPAGSMSSTVADAYADFIAAQESRGLSKRHLSGLRHHVGLFAESANTRQIRSITGNAVLDWLAGLPLDARTVSNYYGSLCNFFNWCERRGLVSSAPTASIHEGDLPRLRPKPKGVLSVDQCAAMMAWIDANAPKYAPWHALQLFAGIRRAEVGRMQWEWIDLEKQVITLPGWTEGGDRVVKTGDDWALHDLPANLWLWLAKYQDKGPVRVPGNDTVKGWRADDFPQIGIPSWPQNAMRHTFCTMMMSLYGDAVKVATWSRHTNTAQLFKSYVAKLVSKEEAERFANIIPCPLA